MAVKLSPEPTDLGDSDSTKTQSPSPKSPDPTDTLIDSIRRDIDSRTNGSIRDLEVSLHEGLVTVSGRTTRYYYKQLATSAVFDFAGDLELQNSISVK